jgi:hypothetical protein
MSIIVAKGPTSQSALKFGDESLNISVFMRVASV